MLAREAVSARLATSRDQLHRVQLPAAAGATTTSSCTAGTAARCRSAARPVGQHHRRRRPHPPAEGGGARARHPAGDQGRRHEVRQDRGRRVWLDPEMTSPVRVLPVLAERRRRRRRALPALIFSFRAARRSRRSSTATAERPAAREAQRALAEELTTLVHGAEECAQVEAAAPRRCSAGATSPTSTPAPWRPRCARPAAWSVTREATADVVDAARRHRPGRQHVASARRTIDGGRRLREQRAGHRRRGRAGEDDLAARPVGWCCAGASARSPASSRPP